MKTISSSLQNFLLTNTSFNRADLISIILPNGKIINALAGTNYTTITYPIGLPATVTISGTAGPWSPTDPNYPFVGTGASSPATVAMSPGQVITLSYASGLVSVFPSGSPSNDPDGFFGPSGVGSPSQYLGASPGAALLGGFANASGWLVAPPFLVGNNLTIGPAPVGTTQLVLGVDDSFYSDNSGSWTMNIIPPVYSASQFGVWERGPYENEASFDINAGSMELMGYIPESVLYPGTTTPLMQALNSLVGSKVIVQTLFWSIGSAPNSGFSMGTMQLTIGQIGNVKKGARSMITCEVFDLTYILNRQFPPHLIQSSCRHTFCDQGCHLVITKFRTTPYALDSSSSTLYLNFVIAARGNTTAYLYGNLIVISNVIYMCTTPGTSAGSAPSFNSARAATTTDGGVVWTSMGSIVAGTNPANQSFPLGYVQGITGQNTGFKRAIKMQTISSGSLVQIQLLWSLPFPVSAGDTFRLFQGCDKTLGTCEFVYLNQIHFGGMPFVPNPEIAQ